MHKLKYFIVHLYQFYSASSKSTPACSSSFRFLSIRNKNGIPKRRIRTHTPRITEMGKLPDTAKSMPDEARVIKLKMATADANV